MCKNVIYFAEELVLNITFLITSQSPPHLVVEAFVKLKRGIPQLVLILTLLSLKPDPLLQKNHQIILMMISRDGRSQVSQSKRFKISPLKYQRVSEDAFQL